MKRQAKLSKRDRKMYQIIIAAFILLCVLIGCLCFWYYLRLQDTVKTESRGYMQEISRQMGTNVNKNINDKYSVLGTMSTVLRDLNVSTYDQLQTVVNEQRNLWNYQKLLLIDKNGAAYDEKGNTVALSSDSYLQDVMVHKTPSLSTSQVIDGKESIIFAIPIENVTVNGTEMHALAASYDLSTFDKILAMTAFDGKGYAHIVRSDGSAIVRSSSPNALQTGYNILNSLSEAKICDDRKMDEIKAEIAGGKSGQMEFALEGTHEYMTYLSLGEQKWSLLTFVPVDAVNAKSNMLLNITLLLCGLISLSFALLLAALMFTFYRNKKKLEQIAYVDSVTGGNTIERFYELAKGLLANSGKTQYALIYTNIEKFKVLNEQFGRQVCDEVLSSLEEGISSDLSEDECTGRLFADNFCILVKYTDEASLQERFEQWNQNGAAFAESKGAVWLPLIIEFGVYVLDNTSLPFSQMVDRAKLSLSESGGELHGKIRYAIYDEKVRRLLFREKQLEDWMEDALANQEFQVYLQPKYRTQSENIGGAEALVRWVSASEGMIYPDEFIPLFEKNGFVVPLDFYVFEEVCKTIRKWRGLGLQPVKVSVNCSRLHLKNTDFLKKYCLLTDKYNVPRHFLEIELTENTVFEDVGNLSDIIRQIHSAGFGCSMDDFGSGYSSLNLIQDIPVDTLKLDKIFFRSTRDLQRSESVVGSIIAMSKALSMDTVAEGVEEREQVTMLKRLNCDYVQGYFFAKPMPIPEFEKLAFPKMFGLTTDNKEGSQ